MICAEARELLESYVKGSTDAAAREALEAHFATCEGCRLEAELTRGVHAQSEPAEDGALVLEPLTTAQLPDDYIPPPGADSEGHIEARASGAPSEDAEEEISFADLVVEAPEASSTAAPVPPVPPAAPVEAAKPKAAAPVWDFEPVDPPREAGPPAESLNLAEQAIARKAEAKAKGKHAALRVVLWAAGGLSGIALLGVSIWIALASNQEPTTDSGLAPIRQGSATAGEVSPSEGQAEPAPAAGAPDLEGTPTDGPGETSPPPPPADGSVGSQEAGVEPATTPDGRVLRAGTLPAAGNVSDAVAAAPPKQAKQAPSESAARSPSTAKSATGAHAPARTATARPAAGAPKPGPEATSAGAPSSGSRKPLGPQPPADDLEPVADESEIPFAAAPKRGATPSPSAAGSTQAGGTAKPAPEPSGSVAAPSAGAESGAATTPTTPTPSPAPSKPIDRLHEATVQAAAAEDVEALRKLKVSWKSMIRTATAAERARAKREYADCLWALQELSGRTPDRREALAAYREYVLYAPAGANDSRTVGRMRFLEDVLSESE